MFRCNNCGVDNPPFSQDIKPGATDDDPPVKVTTCLKCKGTCVEVDDQPPPARTMVVKPRIEFKGDADALAKTITDQIRAATENLRVTTERAAKDVDPRQPGVAPAPLPLAKLVTERLRFVKRETKRLRKELGAFEREEQELEAQTAAIKSASKAKKLAPVRKLADRT